MYVQNIDIYKNFATELQKPGYEFPAGFLGPKGVHGELPAQSYIYVNMYLISIYMSIYIYICVPIYLLICVYICLIFIYVYICVYIFTNIYTDVYI